MVSASMKSPNRVLLHLLLTQSTLPTSPHCILAIITLSLWPVLTLASLRTSRSTLPTNNANKSSLIFSVASISTGSNTIPSPEFSPPSSALLPLNAPPTSSKLSKTSAPLSGKASSGDAFIATNFAKMCYFGKHGVNRISSQVSHPCKHLPHARKSPTSHSHINLQSALSKLPPSPGSSEEDFDDHLEPSSSYASTSHSPLSRTTLTQETLPPHTKASTFPLQMPSPSPPEASPTKQPISQPTKPLFDLPFIITWNIPDQVCNKLNISLDTSPFQGITTPAKVPGQFLFLFYTDRLGLYPYVDIKSKKTLNGGIPQNANLKTSMAKAREDINYYIPSKTTRGLAVIDWEEWRPLWDRNWGNKKIYQTLSVTHAMQRNVSLTAQEAAKKAKQEFQEAARKFMSDTLQTGKNMRPNYFWGFYLFPNCYNYGWQELNYTGDCTEEVKRQNDELLWLWQSSTALYPSVYLQTSIADNSKAALMVRSRVREALRVSALPMATHPAPVFAYMRPVFVDQNKRFLSQGDLVSTIGETAAVGASGAVLWGASVDFNDQTSCEALSSYLTSILNPYITNVTAATQLCSNFLCRGNGRCVRKNFRSNHYLHLNPENFRIVRVQGRYLVVGKPSLADLKSMGMKFKCQCYKGLSCAPRTHKELSKILNFTSNQGSYQRFHTLSKGMFDGKLQATTKEHVIEKECQKGNVKKCLTA